MRRRSSRKSAASSQRAASTAVVGSIKASSRVAAGAVIAVDTPPGISSHSTAMADPKLRAAKTLNELLECLEPMVADLEVRLNMPEIQLFRD
jgi:hypothetical protein